MSRRNQTKRSNRIPQTKPSSDNAYPINEHIRRGIQAREQREPLSRSINVGDGEAVIQVSNITGPVTISHVETAQRHLAPEQQETQKHGPPEIANPMPPRETPAAPIGKTNPAQGLAKSTEQTEPERTHKEVVGSTAALVTSGAAIATGIGVLSTSLRQLLRPLLNINGLGSIPLSPRSVAAAVAAIIGTALIGSFLRSLAKLSKPSPKSRTSDSTEAANPESEHESGLSAMK